MRAVRTTLFALACALPAVAHAQNPLLASATATPPSRAGRSAADPRPVARPAVRASAVVIDGKLDDAAWAAATPIGELVQQYPDEGAAPSQKTELRILYDETSIYVGARMFDTGHPEGPLMRRDQLFNSPLPSDRISLVLDPYRDRITRAWFEINPLGVKGDHMNGDASWDPVWDGAAHIDSLGWTAEFRIPLSQLRFGRDSVQVWGFQVWRTIARRNEQDMWAFWKQNEPGGPPSFGSIEGLRIARQPRQMEFVPYVVSRATFDRPAPNDPFHSAQERSYRAGADLKVNITSNLTLDATLNPDFGQVEVDPAVVNLSAFETSFQEKRPFFISNQNSFSFGSFNCIFCSNVSNLSIFYSRRIGRYPQLAGIAQSRGEYADVPDASTILGAAKITGRTRNGWTVGLLDALTDRAEARYAPAGGPVQSMEVEPRTNYAYGRLRKDFRNGDTRVGLATTLTNRFMGSDSLERSRLRSNASLLGADVQHFWGNRAYSVIAQAALTDVRGDSAAIRRTQESSARYYQRPDRDAGGDGLFDTGYDPTRTSLNGYALYARVGKDGGNWVWETAQNWRSPGFEVNDIAFLSRADYRWMNANVGRRWTKPGSWYQNMFAAAGGQLQYNYEGDRNDGQVQSFWMITWPNFMSTSAFVIHRPVSLDERLTRGGPTVQRYGYDLYHFDANGDSRKPVQWYSTIERLVGIGGPGGNWNTSAGVTVKPLPSVQLSIGPSFSTSTSSQQYVTAVSDTTSRAFAGQRYVFGTIDQKTLSMDTRLSATFTPTMTLELFAQPFIASGRYYDFKEFAAPRTGRMLTYGRDLGKISPNVGADGIATGYTVNTEIPGSNSFSFGNPDFNMRSLRGTAVMRWEYRPGSTLFLVWTQERSGSDAYGNFDFARDRAALFRDRPKNVVQLKASYWIGR